jgi:hypothetical protein
VHHVGVEGAVDRAREHVAQLHHGVLGGRERRGEQEQGGEADADHGDAARRSRVEVAVYPAWEPQAVALGAAARSAGRARRAVCWRTLPRM